MACNANTASHGPRGRNGALPDAVKAELLFLKAEMENVRKQGLPELPLSASDLLPVVADDEGSKQTNDCMIEIQTKIQDELAGLFEDREPIDFYCRITISLQIFCHCSRVFKRFQKLSQCDQSFIFRHYLHCSLCSLPATSIYDHTLVQGMSKAHTSYDP